MEDSNMEKLQQKSQSDKIEILPKYSVITDIERRKRSMFGRCTTFLNTLSNGTEFEANWFISKIQENFPELTKVRITYYLSNCTPLFLVRVGDNNKNLKKFQHNWIYRKLRDVPIDMDEFDFQIFHKRYTNE